MKAIFVTVCTLVPAFASPMASAGHELAQRNTASALDALSSTIKTHTANINRTLASLPANATTPSSNSTNSNITEEYNLIAIALNTTSSTLAGSSKRSVPLLAGADECDATCQQDIYNELGSLSAEIAYTMEGCIERNAVDISTSSSVLITVVLALANLTNDLGNVVGGIAGVVVQTLQAAMGTEIGGILASLVSVPIVVD
ncbi:hypothetical protein M406DRAFT_326041 [Cryphonectria parasitica EP155]|uniref:Uncharacterized protein n=1 Tax=Cryphonectria parasitica (strain ATCC 38755 / EP155) TaxID=660469 RepID=A0A9P4YDD8_CRYP1|nr:uncharacterized protein M406DRAFT_326041 [Cryphonectria parasitica EP155]KAF3770595.1 hypothetical protein M406DRAFT_326041 [Cryphonectria parasitica EP155]